MNINFRFDSASIAQKIADEYGSHFKTNFEELSPSNVDERLRLLSEEVHRGLGSVNDFFAEASASSASESAASVASAAAASAASSIVASPSFQLVRPTEPVAAAAGASDEWTPIADPTGYHTPRLPSDIELGFVHHVDYDHRGAPNRFVKTSVMYADDGKATGFVSTHNFKYEQSVTPTAVNPSTTATMVVSSKATYDTNASGYFSQEPDEEPKEVSVCTRSFF